jgi:hypothetical protein
MSEKAYILLDPGKGLDAVEGGFAGGQGLPQFGFVLGASHSSHQALCCLGAQVESSSDPFRKRPRSICRRHLCLIEMP